MLVTIVGSGLSGATAAVMALRAGHEVEVFETRSHIGGNCYDSDFMGTRVHNYGAHIFHTNDEEVWKFLNQFTSFNSYTHEVKGEISSGDIIPVPFNDVAAELVGEQSEEWIVDHIFRAYTLKQWGVDYDQLSGGVTKRNGLKKRRREGRDCRYFTDKYQGIPVNGYTAMIEAMFEGARVHLNADKDAWKRHKGGLVIYTGPVDSFYDYGLGRLKYRSLKWKHTYGPGLDTAVLNHCHMGKDSTRVVDHARFHPETLKHPQKYRVTSEEWAEDYDPKLNLPIYPVPFKEDQDLYTKYRQLVLAESDTVFLGRLATYKYLDMWMAVKQVIQKMSHYFV